MNRLEIALETIRNCDLCFGKGMSGWVDGDAYDFEYCDCNPNELILDYDGSVIYDGSLFTTAEAN